MNTRDDDGGTYVRGRRGGARAFISVDTLFDPVFKGRERIAYAIGAAIWVVTLVYFWSWWLHPDHIVAWPYYVAVTATLAWVTLLPSYFVLIFFNARRMRRGQAKLPAGRVAMVVTKAPSEPFEVVRKTMTAMLDQIYEGFDVWLADEDPSAETMRWCEQHGVMISTRKGVVEYHRASWPRRTRCKEGNLAYFYDHYGYERYDFVAQFDADHVPERTYLREVMRPFIDPTVGYVSAPSICDANAKDSWSARGRLYAEASLHGSLQAGYNHGWAPLCIGSHYAVRTAALRQIGGLGPELAEDHSTTLMMNAGGWRGVHALDAIAHGDGPANFADLVVQEFQWSRSLVTVLLQHSRHHVPRLRARLKFQFLFSQIWYPLFSSVMALMFLMPVVALVSGHPFVNVTYPQFLMHFAPMSAALIALAFFWRATGTFRPCDAKIFGWEGIAFVFLRWPWSLLGCLAAVRDYLTGSFVDFRITPKGGTSGQGASPLPLRVISPYLVLGLVSVAAALFSPHSENIAGFYIFAAMNALIYGLLTILIVVRHARENGLKLFPKTRGVAMAAVSAMLIVTSSGQVIENHGLKGLEALSHGLSIVTFTESKFAVAGAGLGGGKTKITRFRLQWHGFSTPDATARGLNPTHRAVVTGGYDDV